MLDAGSVEIVTLPTTAQNRRRDRRHYDDVPVTPALDSVLMMILMGSVEALPDEFDWFDWKAEKSWLNI